MKFSDIAHVTQDSREVKPGDFFVACRGEEVDGHDFIPEALKRGAAGVLEEEELFDLAKRKLDAFKPKVIGITGSVGKTTTKEAVAAVLSERFKVLKSTGNINTRRSLSIFILNKLCRDHEIFVVEMAMDRFGEIAEICETVKPDIAVLTAITETHPEKLESLERIKETKAQILDALGVDGLAVLNRDDSDVVDVSACAPGKIIWFGVGDRKNPKGEGFLANDIKMGLAGTSFSLRRVIGSDDNKLKLVSLKVPLLGRTAIYAVLAAAAVGLELGLSFSEIKRGSAKLKPVPQRLNLIESKNGFYILDDSYNASDVSASAALEVLADLPAKRKIAVLGDMLELGSHEKKAHQTVGKKVATMADVLVAVGKLGRLIGESAQEAGLASVYFAKDNQQVIEILKREISLQEGDIVLVKGSRGAEMEEIVAALR